MTPGDDTASAARSLGLTFNDPDLLAAALTHPSWSAEHGGPDYQRLEFLGDSVLGVLVADIVYRRFPDLAEGDLSRMKMSVVRMGTLARAARDMGLAEHIRLGKGARQGGEHERPSVLEAVMEAVIGAVYLDGGLEAAREFVDRALAGGLDPAALLEQIADSKSRLQEHTQAKGLGLPEYRTTGHEGPDHARTFFVEVSLDGVVIGRGSGASKRLAAQEAAAEALSALTAG